MLEKSPEAFKTIREAAEMLGVEQHVLRFWETKFPQIKPMKRRGGRRYYRASDMDALKRIHHLLYQQGYTIAGARKALQEKEPAPQIVAVPEVVTAPASSVAQLDMLALAPAPAGIDKARLRKVLASLVTLRKDLQPAL